jgi:hypothetical protein
MTPEHLPIADPSLEAEARTWLTSWRAGQSDDDIWIMCYIQAKVGGGANDFVQQKWLQMGLAELSRRSNERLRNSIEAFSQSSDRLGKLMLWLTVALLVLTVVLVFDVVLRWIEHGF